MTQQGKEKGWLDYNVPIWLRYIAAIYLIFGTLVLVLSDPFGKAGLTSLYLLLLFVLGAVMIIAVYFLWVYKQKINPKHE
jgi:hypothetical protein